MQVEVLRVAVLTLLAALVLVSCSQPPASVPGLLAAVSEDPTAEVGYPQPAFANQPQHGGAWTASARLHYSGDIVTYVFTLQSMAATGGIIFRAGVPMRVRARYLGERGDLPAAGAIVEVAGEEAGVLLTTDDIAIGLTGPKGTIAVDVKLRESRTDVVPPHTLELWADEYKVSDDGQSLSLVASVRQTVEIP